MKPITYRIATVGDAPAVATVEVTSKRESISHLESEFSMGYGRSFERWSGYIAGTRHPRLAKPKRVVFLASDKESVIGYIGCHHAQREQCGEDWQSDAELQQIYILKTYQRRGIGTHLFSMMVDWLRFGGMNSLVVGYHETNPYRAFYFKMGGKEVSPGLCHWDDLTDWSPTS